MQTMTAGNSSTSPTSYVDIVTKTDIESAFWKKQKITLIKLYREKFNKNLIESKNAIETVLPHIIPQTWETEKDTDIKLYTNTNLQKMFELFFPAPDSQNENDLFFAITKMKENWRYLGYKSFKDAILAIMQNFQKDHSQ